jgi:rhodanese-related sulfurtransferase
VALQLIKMGYRKTYALKGGWWEWAGAGYPMERK